MTVCESLRASQHAVLARSFQMQSFWPSRREARKKNIDQLNVPTWFSWLTWINTKTIWAISLSDSEYQTGDAVLGISTWDIPVVLRAFAEVLTPLHKAVFERQCCGHTEVVHTTYQQLVFSDRHNDDSWTVCLMHINLLNLEHRNANKIEKK